jgi:DNA adenine methylase
VCLPSINPKRKDCRATPEAEDDIRPFLKWAGGKRWLLRLRPDLFANRFNRYIEPFLGSGAVFFYLSPPVAMLGDKNSELIDAFRAIQQNWKHVARGLKRHHRLHSVDHYYRMRLTRPRSSAARAARLIYLNKTCWNGLYRVNKRGWFNVPIGTKSNVFSDGDDFEAYATLLSNATLHACDFQELLDQAGAGDFVFVDPPYTVRHNNNGFVKYNEILFSWADQVRLSDAVRRAAKRGAKLVVTNAAHKSLIKLYSDFAEISYIRRHSVIAADSAFRGPLAEAILTINC